VPLVHATDLLFEGRVARPVPNPEDRLVIVIDVANVADVKLAFMEGDGALSVVPRKSKQG